MNYNSKIQWHSGMMLTKELFAQMQEDMTLRQQIAMRLAMGGGRYGILPDTPLHIDGIFVRRTYEMTGLQCTALLPSGRIISVDADLRLPITIGKEDGNYYVTLEFGEGTRQYEREGVAYEEPEVVLALRTMEELETLDALPLKHFVVEEETLTPDEDYIMPVMECSVDARIAEMVHGIADSLKALAQHPNMENGDCRRAMLHYAFLLNGFNMSRRMTELTEVLMEVAQALDYYFIECYGNTIDEIPEKVMKLKDSPQRIPRQEDIRQFMAWLGKYVGKLSLIMDKVVIEKPEIDIEALKKEIHDQLLEELREPLFNELLERLRQQLTDELPEPIIEKIRQYITETTEPELQTRLHDSLRDPLYNDLYEALMQIIRDMLANLELKQPDNFVPLI